MVYVTVLIFVTFCDTSLQPKMLYPNTIKHSSGDILTGKLWRKDNPLFYRLPFHSNIAGVNEIGGWLEEALSPEEEYKAILVVSIFAYSRPFLKKNLLQQLGEGLDTVYPFSDTTGVDVILRDAEKILSSHLDAVGRNSSSRIWGFLSKFVMLDRFSKTLGAADIYPGLRVPRKICSTDYLGTGAKVSKFLHLYDYAKRNFRSFLSSIHQRKLYKNS